MTTTVDPQETGRAVTELTAAGKSASQIAVILGIAPRTVTRWRSRPIAPDEPLPTTWQDQATCANAQVDPRWFIPADDGRTSYARGRAICMRCPVRDACLTDALTRERNARAEDRAGLWGGLSPEQRANLAAVRRKKGQPA